MSLNTANLAANLKERLSDEQALFAKYFTMMDNDGHMVVYENVVDKLPLYELDVADPGQPGKSTFTPKTGVLDWVNRTLQVQEGEVTLEITKDQIEAFHKTHLAKIAAATRRGSVYDLPFEQYMFQRVIAKLVDQIERTMKWKGARNAAGTTSADIADGFETKIAADITATVIPAANVATGALGGITEANAEAEFKKVVDVLTTQNPEYLAQDLVCYASPEAVRYYWLNYRANHGALPYNQNFAKRILDDMDNIELLPQIGLSGDSRVVITPRFNFALGSDALERINNIEIEYHKRNILFMIDFKIGTEYGIAELIWTNDQ